jgi:hypothetical protein
MIDTVVLKARRTSWAFTKVMMIEGLMIGEHK